MDKPWSLLKGGQAMFTMPRRAVVRSFVINHIIHHRAVLCVYLRLNDVPVPGMYGPSGDDGGFLEAFAFGAVGRPLGDAILAARGERMHVAGHLTLDRWGGGERVRFRVLDIANAGLRRA